MGATMIIRIIAKVVISSEIVVASKTVTAVIRVAMMAITMMGIIEQLGETELAEVYP
jgi:hypothetical protein